MRVLCIDDKNQPDGAEVASGQEYGVKKVVYDTFGTKAYLLDGITNQGLTNNGLNWYGYAARRFAVMSNEPVEVLEEVDQVPTLN